jgi:hypothetical protein
MMEAVSTSETLLNCYQTTRRYNPEDSHLLNIRRHFKIKHPDFAKLDVSERQIKASNLLKHVSREHSRAEQSRAERSRAEQSGAEQSRAEQSRAEQSRAEQSRAQQSTAERSRAQRSKAEQSRAFLRK